MAPGPRPARPVGIASAVFVFILIPQRAVFAAVARSCLHSVMPIAVDLFGLSGHSLADAAVIIPGLALAGSLLLAVFGILRAAIALRVHLHRRSCGTGPLGSTVVEDPEVVVAVTGLGRPRLVISKAALGLLDEQELAAGLAHELGHVHRGHRPLLFLAAVLGALGRLLPGTAAAERGLAFNLERDANEYAVAQTRDPLALTSAICKAFSGPLPAGGLTALRGRGGVTLRLEYLLSGGRSRAAATLERSTRLLAVLMAVLTLALSVTVSAWAVAAPSDLRSAGHARLACAP